jgi:hypothetical protein
MATCRKRRHFIAQETAVCLSRMPRHLANALGRLLKGRKAHPDVFKPAKAVTKKNLILRKLEFFFPIKLNNVFARLL